MSYSRREFLKWSALGLGTGILPATLLAKESTMHGMSMRSVQPAQGHGACKSVATVQNIVPKLLDPSRLTPFVDALTIPPVLHAAKHKTLRIAMQASEQRLHRDLPPTRLWTYNGTMPGPTIEARSGQSMRIDWRNDLPTQHFLPIDHNLCGAETDQPDVRAIVHLHGARVPAASDGYPEEWYVPGHARTFEYPNEQDAATLWYHDHAMGIERLNMYAGLFGTVLLRDEHELSLGLPKDDYEIPLTLTDRMLTEDAQLYYPVSGIKDAPWVSEVFGNAILINGTLRPYLQVEPRRYRFRVVNAANGRFFHLRLKDHHPFTQIGSDQGLLAAPVVQQSLMLAPGERADLIVDFAALAGQSIEFFNDAVSVMQFRVGQGQLKDDSLVPAVLRELPRTVESSATRTRQLTLDGYASCTDESSTMLMLLDGKRWRDPVTENPLLGSTEIWSLVNLTDDTHPIHLHGVRFQILDRRPFDINDWMASQTVRYLAPAQPPLPHEAGWKDTVQTWPGMVTRIIVKFDGYAGRYVWHCHLLEHSANEMMRPFNVIASAKMAADK